MGTFFEQAKNNRRFHKNQRQTSHKTKKLILVISSKWPAHGVRSLGAPRPLGDPSGPKGPQGGTPARGSLIQAWSPPLPPHKIAILLLQG